MDHPVYAAMQAASPTTFSDFLKVALVQAKKILQQGIDTAEERNNVVAAIMAYYDQYINSHVPASMQASIREGVVKGLTAGIETAANL